MKLHWFNSATCLMYPLHFNFKSNIIIIKHYIVMTTITWVNNQFISISIHPVLCLWVWHCQCKCHWLSQCDCVTHSVTEWVTQSFTDSLPVESALWLWTAWCRDFGCLKAQRRLIPKLTVNPYLPKVFSYQSMQTTVTWTAWGKGPSREKLQSCHLCFVTSRAGVVRALNSRNSTSPLHEQHTDERGGRYASPPGY